MSTRKITIVSDPEGDWEGLFVDGKLVQQNHSLTWWHVLDALHIEYETKEADGEWMGEYGCFPVNLEDVLFNKD